MRLALLVLLVQWGCKDLLGRQDLSGRKDRLAHKGLRVTLVPLAPLALLERSEQRVQPARRGLLDQQGRLGRKVYKVLKD